MFSWEVRQTTMNAMQPGSKPSKPRPHPCDACRKSKLKCSQARPTCDTCTRRKRECTYTPLDDESGRLRRFHHRSKDGCQHCRARRVRCDERKPICLQCSKKGEEYKVGVRTGTPVSNYTSPGASETLYQNGFRSNFASPPPSIPPLPHSFSHQSVISPPDAQSLRQSHPVLDRLPLTEPYVPFSPLAASPAESPSVGVSPETIPPSSSEPLPPFSHPENTEWSTPHLPITQAYMGHRQRPGHFFATGPPTYEPSRVQAPTQQSKLTASLKILDEDGNECPEEVIKTCTSMQKYSQAAPDGIQSVWHQRHPMSTTFLYQSLLVQQPDELTAYFPSIEQRHQYRHFFNETAQILMFLPTDQPRNPWLTHLTYMAVGKPHGEDLAHDSLRLGLLSLASFDIGFKMQSALQNPHNNAMYATSMAQRQSAVASLQTGFLLGIFNNDMVSADLALGTVLCIAIHDRLAGCHEWEEPLRIGVSIIESYGGPAAYLGTAPSSTRRFLVEQMACVELLGCLTSWYAPRLLPWDSSWILENVTDGSVDHIESVYGWTRSNVEFSARSMILADEYRQCVHLEAQLVKNPYPQVQQSLQKRFDALKVRSLAFLEYAQALRNETLMTPHSPRLTLANLTTQQCLTIWIRSAVLGYHPYSQEVQSDNLRLLELLDEAMARGIVQGLLLPMTWAAAVASPEHRPQVDRLFSFLLPQYHLERNYMHRLRHANWPEWCGIGVTDWEPYMREHGYYAPVF